MSQRPTLARFRVGEKPGEHRVLEAIARPLVVGDAFPGDAQRLQLLDGERRLGRVGIFGSKEDEPEEKMIRAEG